ncbi:MAG: glycosyltransferase family 4 protein [Verrucomicrobiota bacterium]
MVKESEWIFIGSVYPESWEERFDVGSSPTIDVQRSLLAAMGRAGWKANTILTTPPISRFPKDRFQSFPRSLEGRVEGQEDASLISLGWNNLEPLKTIGITSDTRAFLRRWSERVRREGKQPRVLVYNLGPTHEQGGFLAGMVRALRLPTFPIVTDLDYPGDQSVSIRRQRFRWQVRLLKSVNGFAAFNPRVIEDFGGGKRTLHLSGIVPDVSLFETLNNLPPKGPDDQPPLFLYAGSLNRPRGIQLLLDAFRGLPPGCARLRVTGRGPDEQMVRRAVDEDPSIEYGGFLESNEERIQKIREADILVNPHLIDLPEARYLFPSKLGEYLVSGRLVVTTLLPGMDGFPLDSMVVSKSDSVESFKDALQAALEMNGDVRKAQAEKARAWARVAFDWDQNAEKLLSFLREWESSL